jgi:sugar phosphate isomerase/epimerase
MKSCVTMSLVPEAKDGPFVLRGSLEEALSYASRLGFDAVEIFAPSPESLPDWLPNRLKDINMSLAALGTGAGWLLHRWSLSEEDASRRQAAVHFIESFIAKAATLGAMVIIGSMQGKADGDQDRPASMMRLAESLIRLNQFALGWNVKLLLEPLNRDETNLLKTVSETRGFLQDHGLGQFQILADLFHLRREEDSVASALLSAGDRLGHVHFVGPTRAPVEIDDPEIPAIIDTLKKIHYRGYLSAEARPIPSSEAAASQAINAFRHFVGISR